jgi:hypothetical protein
MSGLFRSTLSALWCCVFALGGCSEGYSTEEGALILKHGMSRDAALKAMNTIGQHSYLDDRWRYELQSDCRLRIESHALANGSTELAVLAARVDATVVDELDPDSHTVFAHAGGEAPTNGTPVLDSANWLDATQMKWLINYLPVICEKPIK